MQQQLIASESYQKYENKYEHGNHYVGISMWEFEWVTKYRYKMFRKWKYKKLVEACIRRAASLQEIIRIIMLTNTIIKEVYLSTKNNSAM